MADFAKAYDKTMTHEGGYANHPNDRGGETYRGIARKFHPDWAGWETIDEMKAAGWIRNNRVEYISAAYEMELSNLVESFYKNKFWDKLRLDSFRHQALAEKVFDIGVNGGLTLAGRLLQQAVNIVTGDGLVTDGKIGPKTIEAVNTLSTQRARSTEVFLRVGLGQHYANIIQNDPSQRVFVNGWADRVFG